MAHGVGDATFRHGHIASPFAANADDLLDVAFQLLPAHLADELGDPAQEGDLVSVLLLDLRQVHVVRWPHRVQDIHAGFDQQRQESVNVAVGVHVHIRAILMAQLEQSSVPLVEALPVALRGEEQAGPPAQIVGESDAVYAPLQQLLRRDQVVFRHLLDHPLGEIPVGCQVHHEVLVLAKPVPHAGEEAIYARAGEVSPCGEELHPSLHALVSLGVSGVGHGDAVYILFRFDGEVNVLTIKGVLPDPPPSAILKLQ